MDGIGWEWIAGGMAAMVVAFVAGRLSGGGLERRTDLSGPPGQASARIAAPRPSGNATFAASPLLEGLTPEARQAIAGALAAGNKIQAIKLLREATGLGLRESKDLIEAIGG